MNNVTVPEFRRSLSTIRELLAMPQRFIISFSFILAFCGLLPLIYGQETVVQPERAELQKLEQADKLFENGRDNEAGQLLGQLLESCKDGSFYTDANAEIPQTVPFRNYLVDKLSKLPKTARESYSFQFEIQAKRLLDDAVENASLDAVSDIARKYTPTRAGADAALTVALMQFENGDNQAAKLNLLRLKNNTAATPDIIRHVDEYLKRIEDRQKNTATVKISEADYLDIIGWRLPEGLPNQNPITNITPPILDCRWKTPIAKPSYERVLLSLQKSVKRSSDIYLQAPMPMIAGGKLITRCLDDITAIDIQTGKRIWSVTEPQHYVKHPYWIAPYIPIWKNSEMQHNILRLELWHNRIAQQLSSNGNLFFSIDGHRAMPTRGRGSAKIVLAGKFYEDRRNEPGNTLTARDIQTGEIVWQTGHFPLIQKYFDECVADADNTMAAQKKKTDEQPDNETNKNTPKENQTQEIEPNYTSEEKPFLETWFLGTPLPIGNRLFVIAETNSLIQLFVLESQNGKLLRQIPLAQASQPIESALLRRLYPLTPSASGGLILCPTGTGLTVALDATSLETIWCFRYGDETKDTPNERMNRNQIQAFAMPGNHIIDQYYRQSFSASGWQIPSIMIDGDSAVVAPPDQADVYCLDLLTGKKRWHKNIGRQQALYTACIRNGNVFIVTPNELTAFDLQSGNETKKITFPLVLRPCGTGIPGGDQYFIPFTGGYLAQVDLQNGTIHWLQMSGQSLPAARQVSANAAGGYGTYGSIGEPEIPAVFFNTDDNFGNLVGVQECVFSLSPSAIMCFDQKIPLAKYAEAALKSNPNDAAGLLQYGRVLKDDGKLSEAVAAFRQSMKIQNTADAADQLRHCLLEAVRKDYSTWNNSADELLALAELPEETAAILYALAEGAFNAGQKDKYHEYVQKALALAETKPMLIDVNANLSVQLRYAFRCVENVSDRSNTTRNPQPVTRNSAWNTGTVNVEEATQTDIPTSTPDQRQNEIVARILRLAKNADKMSSLHPLPYLGNTDDAANKNRYALAVTMPQFYLVCYTNAGKELWRIGIADDRESLNGMPRLMLDPFAAAVPRSGQLIYVTGAADTLIFVRNDTVTALTTETGTPKILWKKTFASVLPFRENNEAKVIRQVPGQNSALIDSGFPPQSVFVSPDVVCVSDTVAVTGIEPKTGQVLWIRKVPGAASCSLLGNDRHLFLVYPNTRQAIAVDPLCGAGRAVGIIPPHGLYCYKTKIVFLRQHKHLVPEICAFDIADLNDLFDKRKRALVISDTHATLPVQSIEENLDLRSLVRMLQNARYFAMWNRLHNTLQIFDIETMQNVFNQDVPLDVMLPKTEEVANRYQGDGQRGFDAEFVDDKVLVYLVRSTNVGRDNPIKMEENGISFMRHYSMLQGVAGQGIGIGSMMLFDVTGRPCWSRATEIANWYYLSDVPDDIPVSLFSVAVTDRVGDNVNTFATGLLGIDKRTGVVRFRELVSPLRLPNQGMVTLQDFRVGSDAESQEIHFVTSNVLQPRIVKAVFGK